MPTTICQDPFCSKDHEAEDRKRRAEADRQQKLAQHAEQQVERESAETPPTYEQPPEPEHELMENAHCRCGYIAKNATMMAVHLNTAAPQSPPDISTPLTYPAAPIEEMAKGSYVAPDSPMGVSAWIEHGKRYGYFDYAMNGQLEAFAEYMKTTLDITSHDSVALDADDVGNLLADFTRRAK